MEMENEKGKHYFVVSPLEHEESQDWEGASILNLAYLYWDVLTPSHS